MTRGEARQIIATWLVSSKGTKGQLGYIEGWFDEEDVEAFRMAIEALKAKCPTCKRCSDHQESGTRCPIEEHYLLPKDGYCHLYEPYRKEQNNET